jgi:hypothetical protein
MKYTLRPVLKRWTKSNSYLTGPYQEGVHMRLKDFQAVTTAKAIELVSKKQNSKIQIVINIAQYKSSRQQAYETLKNTCHKFLTTTPLLTGTVHCDVKVLWPFSHEIPVLNRYRSFYAPRDINVTDVNLTK